MKRTKVLVALLLAAGSLATSTVAQPAQAKPRCAKPSHKGGDWPMFGRDYAGGHSQPAEKKIGPVEAAGLAPEWVFSANEATGDPNNEITGYPIIAGGCVFVGSSTGQQTPGWVFSLNADTGEVVWKTKVSHGIYSTAAVHRGKVYVFVSRHGDGGKEGPYVAALDQATGKVLWTTTVDIQEGADAVSSPIIFDGLIFVGISGTAAEGDESDRLGFQGNFVLLDAHTGKMVKKTWTIPQNLWDEGYAGGAIWSTIAVDTQTKYAYVGTGNPFNYDSEHERTNAMIKVDLDRRRSTFGEVVGSYKGDVEEYFPGLDAAPCEPTTVLGLECLRLDLDFGAQPQIFKDSDGNKIVGIGQKSGVYHAVEPKNMKSVWKSVVGVPSLVGGVVGTPAYDGENLYGPHTIGGYMWSLEKNAGMQRWISPFADAIHWGPPATHANGVVYSVDLKGMLVGMEASTGVQILNRPLLPETAPDLPISWGGVSVARNTIYASIGVGLTSAGLGSVPGGYVIALKPAS